LTGTGSRARFGVGALVALPIVCCVGLSLLVGAGLGVAAVAWIGSPSGSSRSRSQSSWLPCVHAGEVPRAARAKGAGAPLDFPAK